MATFKRLPNNRILMREYLGNGKYKKLVGDTINECKAKMRTYIFSLGERKKENKLTVKEAVELFVESLTNILAPSTIRGYSLNSKNKFKDIANIPLDKLTQLDLQTSINREAAKSLPKTVKNIYGMLLQVLKGYGISFNVVFPQKRKAKIEPPTSETVRKLFDFVQNTEMELPVKLAAMCGLRRSEICALEWSDIDFKNHTLSVNKAIVLNEFNEWVLKSTKSEAGERIVPIPNSLLLRLKELEGLGQPKLNPAQISLRFSRIQKHVSEKHIRFHDLRHYFASVALVLGIPDKYTMEIIGYSTIEMLKCTYCTLLMMRKRIFINY